MTIVSFLRLMCAEPGCTEVLCLERKTPHALKTADRFTEAVHEVARYLGWRHIDDGNRIGNGNVFCPYDVDRLKLECARCAQVCSDCFCMARTRFEARKP